MDGFQPSFLNLTSPGSKLKSFFLLLYSSSFKVYFSLLYQGSQLIWEYLEAILNEKEFLPLSIPNSLFIPYCHNKRAYRINTTMLCGKRKTFCSPGSAGSWRVLGLCDSAWAVSFPPPFSVYCVQRLHCLYCECGWLAFTNMSVYFLLFFLKKKKTFKNGVIEVSKRWVWDVWMGVQ